MRVMVLVKATDVSEQRPQVRNGHEGCWPRWQASIRTSNGGDPARGRGLQPTARAKRIAFDGTRRTVIDGPFAETKELVAGTVKGRSRDMDEAIAWARRVLNPMPVPSEIEIRPLYE